MKKLILALIACCTIACLAADVPISVLNTVNLQLAVTPNGSIDSSPVWTLAGPGGLTVAGDGLTGLFTTGAPGVATITITAVAGSNIITQRIVVTVSAPLPPPATALNVSVTPVPK